MSSLSSLLIITRAFLSIFFFWPLELRESRGMTIGAISRRASGGVRRIAPSNKWRRAQAWRRIMVVGCTTPMRHQREPPWLVADGHVLRKIPCALKWHGATSWSSFGRLLEKNRVRLRTNSISLYPCSTFIVASWAELCRVYESMGPSSSTDMQYDVSVPARVPTRRCLRLGLEVNRAPRTLAANYARRPVRFPSARGSRTSIVFLVQLCRFLAQQPFLVSQPSFHQTENYSNRFRTIIQK